MRDLHKGQRMAAAKKPLVVITRRLPDSVETRMRELFDARLNLDDKPMSQTELVEAVKVADVLVPTVTDQIDRARLEPVRRKAQADRQFRQRRRQYRRRHGAAARHHRHQHAGRADRGHRRHDHGADPGGAAAARRRRPGAHRRQRLDRLVADLDARPPHLGQAARHRRHGPHRPGGGAPRQGVRPADPLSQPPPRAAPRIEEELDATYWESLDQMLARMDIISINCPHTPATYHLLSARRLKLHAARGLCRQHRARRDHRRERAGAHDRGGRDRRRRPRRLRARAGGEPEARQARPRRQGRAAAASWARPRSKAASTWARRSSSTSGPSWTATARPTACCRRCCDGGPAAGEAFCARARRASCAPPA